MGTAGGGCPLEKYTKANFVEGPISSDLCRPCLYYVGNNCKHEWTWKYRERKKNGEKERGEQKGDSKDLQYLGTLGDISAASHQYLAHPKNLFFTIHRIPSLGQNMNDLMDWKTSGG